MPMSLRNTAGIHVYRLDNARDSEDAFMDSMPAAEHAKFALPRLLGRRHGWDKHMTWEISIT